MTRGNPKRSSRHRELTELSAVDIARELASGGVKAETVTRAFLDRIAAEDEALGAYVFVDEDYALEQARALDRHRGTGRAIGPMHGVPVALKDIIDARGLPCERGTVIEAGRVAREDAFVVQRLREAGAVIIGKTVTTELAVYTPGKTRNPHNPERTPGGSSSGSAAAVAACLAPIAIGSQTNGSVIRPASYCGVVGYKPSRGLVSRRGVLGQSQVLDTLGTFGRSVEDAAFAGDAIAGYDPGDPAMQPQARPQLRAIAMTEPPLRPVLGFVRQPVWDQADEDVRGGFAELVEELGDAIEEVSLPAPFDRGVELHNTIMTADIAKSYARYYDEGRDKLSDRLAAIIEEGRRVLAVDYALAHDWIEVLNAGLDRLFDHYDALVTPATTGEAPGIETTGSPIFCTLWTYLGVPAVTVPLLTGSTGLPIGVQLVGRRGNDARLLRTARWMVAEVERRGDESGQS